MSTQRNYTNGITANCYRDGIDGPWSTFRIEVGTPAQQIHVLPASDQSSTWLVLPEGCGDLSASDCSDSHGGLFKRNTSSTWDEFGSYQLSTYLEERVGLNGDGLYGFDKIGLGWSGDGLPSLDNQSIAGIIAKDFWVGSLSLNPRPINFTDFNNPIPSFMTNLRNMTEPIPSLSWSYTAGSHNLAPKVFGSLVLGGYDKSRFEGNNLSFPFGSDISMDFQVAIQDITSNVTTGSLLGSGIIAYISTLVADIWLPTSACQKFEKAFGLIWDNKTELYLLNDTLHQDLLEKNPTVSFKVGPQVSGDSVTINMPYWNFYQTATSALAGNSSGLYFPLKRAANDTQYILGRTFLQSAHLSADYERNVFNLSQARYPSSSTSSDIIAVLPPLEKTSPGAGGNASKSRLGTGAIAGIAVGTVVVIVCIAVAAFILYRRKKAAASKAHELADTDIQHSIPHEVSGEAIKYEVGEGLTHEFPGDMDPKVELGADGPQKPVEADGSNLAIYEMPAEEIKLAEMPGDGSYSTSPKLPTIVPDHDPSLRPDVIEIRNGEDVTPSSEEPSERLDLPGRTGR